MSIGIEEFIPSGAGLVGNIILVTVAWQRMANRVDNQDEKSKETTRQLQALWGWKDELEKDIYYTRERYNERMAKMEGANLVVVEQFKQILAMLSDIKERLSSLEKR